jgi:hypothetical protein
MLEVLSRWLIQQPAHILLIAAINLALWAACRVTVLRTAPKSNVLWVPAVAWLAYAGWERLVLAKSPQGQHPCRPAADLARHRARYALGLRPRHAGLAVSRPAAPVAARMCRSGTSSSVPRLSSFPGRIAQA